jgi:maltose O-acetyltransferase
VAQARWSLRDAEVLGAKVRVRGRPRVANYGGRLLVGARVQIVSTVATTELVVYQGGILDIGERAFINYGCSIAATLRVEIGARCSIGTHVMMMDNDFHRIEPDRRDEMPDSAPIVLGENVWVGGRVIVLNGVTIGRDSVIGAGSVVSSDIPPRSVAAGVPAKVIRAL